MMNPTERSKKKRRGPQTISGGTARLTAPQAPAEHQNNSAGIIRPNTGTLHLPPGLVEPNARRSFERPGRAMLIITGLALIFIAIIAWFVAHEPPKERAAPNEAGSEMRK